MSGPAPHVDRILETALYVEDPDRSARFYQELFGFEAVYAGPRLTALAVPGHQILLLFKKGASSGLSKIPHDGSGELHVAFAIAAPSLEAWEARLHEKKIPIVEKTEWERGGTSLYFRDPDGHLIELATPGLWTNY
ncbi:MAG TPA: VOC family protein [Candidatus Binatia bacterium]|nr:VOC family protein [Candidatus Binatia bacterium]